MQWVYRSLMAVSAVLGGFVAGGMLGQKWAPVAVAVALAAGYFSDRDPTSRLPPPPPVPA